MLRNYLLITLRNLRRQKLYSTINAAGLAIGMGAARLDRNKRPENSGCCAVTS